LVAAHPGRGTQSGKPHESPFGSQRRQEE